MFARVFVLKNIYYIGEFMKNRKLNKIIQDIVDTALLSTKPEEWKDGEEIQITLNIPPVLNILFCKIDEECKLLKADFNIEEFKTEVLTDVILKGIQNVYFKRQFKKENKVKLDNMLQNFNGEMH